MNLIPKKYFLFLLAAVLVVALGIMAIFSRKPVSQTPASENNEEVKTIEKQSDSTDLDSIEKDLNSTDFSGIDSDMEALSNEF